VSFTIRVVAGNSEGDALVFDDGAPAQSRPEILES
jgi:hypothetical protein